MQAEAFEIVEGIVERMDLQFAAIARARIDLADRETAAKPSPRRPLEARSQFGERGSSGSGAIPSAAES